MNRDPEKHREWRRRSVERWQRSRMEKAARGEVRRLERKPTKRTRRKRSAEDFARVYGSHERVRRIQAMPSVVSGKGPCVNAHVPPKGDLSGMGRKPDWRWIVPLTDEEHREQHAIGIEAFEAKHNVDLRATAARLAVEVTP